MRIARGTVLTLLSMVLATGCTTYYRVTDPASRHVYYTDEIKRRERGTIQFRDAKSGADVTLQASEVLEVSSDEFRTNTAK
jgi:hypothetical protein